MTTEIITKDDKLQKSLDLINAFKAEIDLLGEQCSKIKVVDDITLSVAQQNLSKASNMVKFIDDKFTEVKAPYWQACKDIEYLRKSLPLKLVSAVSHLKEEIKNRELTRQKEERDKQAKIDADLAAEKAKLTSVPLTNEVVNDIIQKQADAAQEKEKIASESAMNKTKGIRTSWNFELIDKTELLPEWITIDEAAVKAWMTENKDSLTDGQVISGVKFTKDIIVVA